MFGLCVHSMKSSIHHQNLFKLFQDKESKNECITKDEILNVSKWKCITFRTYLQKGYFTRYLTKVSDNTFKVANSLQITEQEFLSSLSQNRNLKPVGRIFTSNLAKSLTISSKDNMILALELYNRPSLENRLDAFVQHFCTAWEKLLKAFLIEQKGENFIFRNNKKKNKVRETISLQECLENKYNNKNTCRRNIEEISYYRNQGIHLLMPEVQAVMSRYFQAGILNYSKEYRLFTKEAFIPQNNSGFISLVGDLKNPCTKLLHDKYGKETGDEISWLISSLINKAENEDDASFAIPVDVELVFAKKGDSGNIISLAKAQDDIEGLEKAIIIKKPTDREKIYPYRETKAILEINKKLHQKYSEQELSNKLVAKNKITGKHEINSHCFRSVVSKLKWKNSNNEHHYENKDPSCHYFSDIALEDFVKQIMQNEGYLEKAKKSYHFRNKTIKRQNKWVQNSA